MCRWFEKFGCVGTCILICIHTTPEEFEHATTTGLANMIIIMMKSFLSKCFCPPPKRKAAVFKFLRLEQRFRDGLVWTVDLTVAIKVRFRDGLVWTVGLI